MTKYIIGIFATILLTSFAADRKVRDLIEWSPDQDLQWTDYKGKITDTSKIVLSNCGISCMPQIMGDTAEITIQAYFDRNKSWVNVRHTDELLLRHEQGHFNLTEVYARKLKKRISTIRSTRMEFIGEIETAYNELWDDLQKQHLAYDKATEEGGNPIAQKGWEKMIRAQLSQYKQYAEPSVKYAIRL